MILQCIVKSPGRITLVIKALETVTDADAVEAFDRIKSSFDELQLINEIIFELQLIVLKK